MLRLSYGPLPQGAQVAEIYVNPNLPNYFMDVPDVTSAANARSFVAEYEDAKVITFSGLRPTIDHEFWAGLDTDRYPNLKKFSVLVDSNDHCNVEQHLRNLIARGADPALAAILREHFQALYGALIPVYRAIFAGYEFDKLKVVWRLNTILNQNMHIDTYKDENEQHFARMFINLDNQPRIWHTSWMVDDILRLIRDKFPAAKLENKTRGEIWREINYSTFGKSTGEWWDDQPRHVAYFAPGDVWVVDSRQIAHQIFYGRRALSIDFSLPKQLMKNPSRHYLAIVERFRAAVLNEVLA
jgi:hypothetical protein